MDRGPAIKPHITNKLLARRSPPRMVSRGGVMKKTGSVVISEEEIAQLIPKANPRPSDIFCLCRICRDTSDQYRKPCLKCLIAKAKGLCVVAARRLVKRQGCLAQCRGPVPGHKSWRSVDGPGIPHWFVVMLRWPEEVPQSWTVSTWGGGS